MSQDRLPVSPPLVSVMPSLSPSGVSDSFGDWSCDESLDDNCHWSCCDHGGGGGGCCHCGGGGPGHYGNGPEGEGKKCCCRTETCSEGRSHPSTMDRQDQSSRWGTRSLDSIRTHFKWHKADLHNHHLNDSKLSSSGPASLLASLSSLTLLLLTTLLNLFRFPSHIFSSVCIDLLQTVCACVCVCMPVEVCFDCVLFFALCSDLEKKHIKEYIIIIIIIVNASHHCEPREKHRFFFPAQILYSIQHLYYYEQV